LVETVVAEYYNNFTLKAIRNGIIVNASCVLRQCRVAYTCKNFPNVKGRRLNIRQTKLNLSV